MEELQNCGRLCLQNTFHNQLARVVHDGNRDRCLVNIHANILFLFHNGAPFGRWWSNQSHPTSKWAPFILRAMAWLRHLRLYVELACWIKVRFRDRRANATQGVILNTVPKLEVP